LNTRLTPTALDFFINGVPFNKLSMETKYKLSSDHLSIVAPLRQKGSPGSPAEMFKETLYRTQNSTL